MYSDRQSIIFSEIAYCKELEALYADFCANDKNGSTSMPLSKLPTNTINKLKELGITDYELANWTIGGVPSNPEKGFFGCIIEDEYGGASVAFRGSEEMDNLENLYDDWLKADFGLVNSICTTQQGEVEEFLKEYADQLKEYKYIEMTGHSLGGNLAEYATIISERYGLDKKIRRCVSLDGPGHSQEFLIKYRKEIEKMSGVMYHPRWSFVGTMLLDLPGVHYEYIEVENKEGLEEYNSVSRHALKYVKLEGGYVVGGAKQDTLSRIADPIVDGIEHLPTWAGSLLVGIAGGLWYGFAWTKDKLTDEDGKLTIAGQVFVSGLATGVILIVSELGVLTVGVMILQAVVAVLVAAVMIVLWGEFCELVYKVIDTVCDAVEKIYEWGKEKLQEFKDAVVSMFNKAKEWLNNTFNEGYKYAGENPQIIVDTYKLNSYASRLWAVNKRLTNVDRRMDSLYWKIGLVDMWKLMNADVFTGPSWRLSRCASYLSDTANDFVETEKQLINEI